MKEKGIMLSEIGFGRMPLLIKNAGLEFFIIDCEHGAFDYAEVKDMLTYARLCGIKAIVRIPDNNRKDIIKYLDAGAAGLLLPMTSSPDEIKKVVEYAKYPPLGKRGISTMRAHTLYNPPKTDDYVREANERIEIYAQIETADGVNNISEILNVDGVSGVFVGPNDLSADYGCLADSNASGIIEAISVIGAVCKKAGKKSGIITSNDAYIIAAGKADFSMLSKGSELNAIFEYCKSIADSLRVR